MSKRFAQPADDDDDDIYDNQDAVPGQGGLTLEEQLQAALDAQVDDDFGEEDDGINIPDYNAIDEVIPSNLEKVNEDVDEYGQSLQDTSVKMLLQTPKSRKKGDKMASTPKDRKASTVKSERSVNTVKKSEKSDPKAKPKKKQRSVNAGPTKKVESNTPGVGSARNAKELAAQNNAQMKKLLGTEFIIEKILKMLDVDPWDDLGNWAPDAYVHKGMQLSNSRMINQVSNMEPRTLSSDGKMTPYPTWGTNTGRHSSVFKNRVSDIEPLGEGVCLYFKFMKYFMFIFFVCFVLSIPSMVINGNGGAFNEHTANPFKKMMALTTMGNIGSYQDLACQAAVLPDTSNKASYINFACPKGKTIQGLKHFGMAFQNQTCTGLGVYQKVQTLDRCTFGSMDNAQLEANIEERFSEDCLDKRVCSMLIDYTKVFSSECQYEIKRRNNNQMFYGPPKVYGIAMCEIDTVDMGTIKMTREQGAMMVVVLDWFIMFFVAVMIIRLRWFEMVSVTDMKNGKLRIEDFSVYLPNIPIQKQEYHNNPDLLTAQLASHLEEIVKHELQVIPELEEIQENQGQISNIYFGINSQTTMKYMVDIFAECEKIADLRKKIQIDPVSTRLYEAQQWQHYTQVTLLNDAFYEEKAKIDPTILDCYVTFRSMESRERALQGYDIHWFKRIFVTKFCCLDQFFKKKRLVQLGTVTINEAVDPQIILWENIGLNIMSRFKNKFIVLIAVICTIFFSYAGQFYWQYIAKSLKDFKKSECGADELFTNDEVYLDFLEPNTYQLGQMDCYCQALFDLYSEAAYTILFADGQQHCKNWSQIRNIQSWETTFLGAWIAFVNICITYIFNHVGDYMRNKNVAENDISVMTNVFFMSFVNSAILIIIAQNCFIASNEVFERNSKKDIFVGMYVEFDTEWYFNIGPIIIFAQACMLVFPHIFILFEAMGLGLIRCWDRRGSFNTKKTSKIIQDDYETLYTGPEFVLEVRYAQILFTIFVTFTYGSGMPSLYIFNFFIIFVQYWVDKFLVFNYYRRTVRYTKQISKAVNNLLPIMLVFHFVFGWLMYGFPLIYRSETIQVMGNDSLYFNPKRLGQKHMVIWMCLFLLIIFMFIGEKFLVAIWRVISNKVIHCCGSCCAKLNGRDYDMTDYSKAGFVYSDDIFYELDFAQLYKKQKTYKKDKQRFRVEKIKGMFTDNEIKNYIDPYIKILERNSNAAWDRMIELLEMHDDVLRDDFDNYDSMDKQQKVNCLKEIYDKAVDKDNAEKALYMDKINKEMHGKVMNEYKSYDLMDNEKYQRIEYLLKVMQETFGFDLEAAGVPFDDMEDPEAGETNSQATDKNEGGRDNRNATIEMTINQRNPHHQPTQSDFGIFSRDGKNNTMNKQNQY